MKERRKKKEERRKKKEERKKGGSPVWLYNDIFCVQNKILNTNFCLNA